jgi:hypothetical protein
MILKTIFRNVLFCILVYVSLLGSRAAKLPVTYIFVTVTGNVTVSLVTMTEIAEDQVYVHISLIYF